MLFLKFFCAEHDSSENFFHTNVLRIVSILFNTVMLLSE